MVTKTKAGQKKRKVKVLKLKLNKETVKDLSAEEEKKVKGGRIRPPPPPPHRAVHVTVRPSFRFRHLLIKDL